MRLSRFACRAWLVSAVLVLASPAIPAAWGQTPAPAATPASTAAPAVGPTGLPLTDAEHVARGDIKYAGAWVPIDTVFKDYQAAQVELKTVTEKVNAARAPLAEFKKQLDALKNDSAVVEKPIRDQLTKAKAKQRDLNKALTATPPVKPTLKPMPPQPRNPGYSGSSYSSSYSQQMQDWQHQCDAVKRENDDLVKKYADDLAAYKKALDDAKKELPKVDAEVKQCDDKLAQIAADLLVKQAPILEKFKAATEEAQTIQRQQNAVETRLQALAQALRSAPQELQFKHGFAEWEGAFRIQADLEKMLADTQADIDRVRNQMKAEAAAEDRPFPTDWRHPQQDSMDALKALLAKMRAAQGAAPTK